MAKAIPTPHYTTFFCLRETASQFPLSQTKKRQLPITLNDIPNG